MRSEVNCHPLVRSGTCIRTLIERYGNNVEQSLSLLSRGNGTNNNDE